MFLLINEELAYQLPWLNSVINEVQEHLNCCLFGSTFINSTKSKVSPLITGFVALVCFAENHSWFLCIYDYNYNSRQAFHLLYGLYK